MKNVFSRVKVFKGSKYEVYLSFPLALIGLCNGGFHPQLNNVLIEAGAYLLATLCAWNAVLDSSRMNWFERTIAFPWFSLLFVYTSIVLWCGFFGRW